MSKNNICQDDVIPPETDLLQWSNQLRYMGKLALETPIVESDHGKSQLKHWFLSTGSGRVWSWSTGGMVHHCS